MSHIRQKAFVFLSDSRNVRLLVYVLVLVGLLASPIAAFAESMGNGGSGG